MSCPCTFRTFKNYKAHCLSKQHVSFMLFGQHWKIPIDGHTFSENAKYLYYPIECCESIQPNDKLWFVTEQDEVYAVATYSHQTDTHMYYDNLYWIQDVRMTMEYMSCIVKYHHGDEVWIGTRSIQLPQEYAYIQTYR